MPGIGGAAVPLGQPDQRGLQLGDPGRDLPGARRAGRAAGRWRPGRCGCGRPAACRRARRAAPAGRARGRCARPRRRPSAGTCPSRTAASSSSSACEHLAELVVVEQAGAVQHPGVRPRGGQVVGREPPVEVHAHRQRGPARRSARRRTGRPTAWSVRRRPGPRSRLDHPPLQFDHVWHVCGHAHTRARVLTRPPAAVRGHGRWRWCRCRGQGRCRRRGGRGGRPSCWAGPRARRSPWPATGRTVSPES